jgi:hypothetical protein
LDKSIYDKTKGNRLFGTPVFGSKGTHTLNKPAVRRVITDDEHIKCLLTHIFETELRQDTKQMNLLIEDCPTNTKDRRTKILRSFLKISSLEVLNDKHSHPITFFFQLQLPLAWLLNVARE